MSSKSQYYIVKCNITDDLVLVKANSTLKAMDRALYLLQYVELPITEETQDNPTEYRKLGLGDLVAYTFDVLAEIYKSNLEGDEVLLEEYIDKDLFIIPV